MEIEKQIEASGAYACVSLEDAAYKAVALSKGKPVFDYCGFTQPEEEIDDISGKRGCKI